MGGPRLLVVVALAIAAGCAALVATHEPLPAAHAVTRWTARSSLLLFALAYVARPASALWPGATTKWLLRERKWIGNGFAASHVAHLGGIVAIAALDWEVFLAGRSAATFVGIAVFGVLFAMAITSIDRVRQAMSRRAWTALHRAGMHAAWVVFAFSYFGRRPASPVWALPAGVLAAIAVIRATAWARARRPRAAAA